MTVRLLDPTVFVPQMQIVDRQGRRQTLGQSGMFPSQVQFLEAYRDHDRILCLKARQLGITTVATLALLHSALFNPHEFSVLTVTHEAEAMGRVNTMIRNALLGLPASIRPGLNPDNMKALGLTHNGSLFKQLMAGGRSQGRSYTFRAVHATEMGLWPRGSSAREGLAVDEEVWSSIQSTLHGQARVVIESTAHGPSGIFHKMCRVAQESEQWQFLFFPWFSDPSYRRPLPERWERTDEEQELSDLHGLTDEQLAWRRWKLEDSGYTLRQFKQEYPSTPEEPFLVSEGMWYDSEVLNKLLGLLSTTAFKNKEEGWTWYRTPYANEKVFIGVDPSGGTGNDQGVIQVISDRMEQIAVFASRWTQPRKLGQIAAKVSAKFGGALGLIEINNQFGRACYEAYKAAGGKVWLSSEGKPWFTGTWSNRSTKVALHDYGKELIDGGWVALRDPLTIQELLVVREQRDGNIEADAGYNDDRAMALVLALWCARRHVDRSRGEDIHAKIASRRRRRHEELGL